MNGDTLLRAVPDVFAFVRRDGTITDLLGGRAVPILRAREGVAGTRLQQAFDPQAGPAIARLVRRGFASRKDCDARLTVGADTYDVRVSPQGPDRALCIIRRRQASANDDDAWAADAADAAAAVRARRGFARRLADAVADAALRETPLAVCLIFLEGLADVGRAIDFAIADRVGTELLRRLPRTERLPGRASWTVGLLGESVLGVLVEGRTDRDALLGLARELCASLAGPVALCDAEFYVTPSAGVAILGEDATRPGQLLDHARSAMLEARRAGPGAVHFYSDTLPMRPLARVDFGRELGRAIADGGISLRWTGRYDLESGRLLALQAYVRWLHPLRGEVAPAEFIAVADATGQALDLSRAALAQFGAELPVYDALHGGRIDVSFGALRQHLASGLLERDCADLLARHPGARGRLELRIAERTLAEMARPDRTLAALAALPAAVVVEEIGRSFSSLSRLGHWPLRGLQIDRATAVASARDEGARRGCRVVAAIARALGAVAVAPGVDDGAARERLAALGFAQGLGDAFPAVAGGTPGAGAAVSGDRDVGAALPAAAARQAPESRRRRGRRTPT
ncbi:MAG: GGDEF domain-containing phosphodiesterase [Steroidobacteraceae bacterium]|nr:GGDEF domain-containing phosphodiesterase [Steroidobacteraceae bacterium]